jgi:competence protein ComEC
MSSRPHPLLVPLISYVAGILLRDAIGPSGLEPPWFPLAACAFLARLGRFPRAAAGLAAAAAIALGAGNLDRALRPLSAPGDGPPGLPETARLYEGRVATFPNRHERGYAFEVRIDRPVFGVARVFVEGDRAPEKGERIRFRARLRAPRNFGNAHEFDAERHARARGIDWHGSVAGPGFWETTARAGWLARAFSRFRSQASERAEVFLSPLHAPLLRSMVMGDGSGVGADTREAFRKAGVVHLLVVSGFQVAVAAGAAAALAGGLASCSAALLVRVPRWNWRLWGALAGALFFCGQTNLPPPTLRALFAVFAVLAAALLRKPVTGWGVLLVVAAAVLLAEPLWLFDVSAQLSFSAVAGILAALRFHRPLRTGRALVDRLGTFGLALLVTSVGAGLATMPILIRHFHTVSVWTIPGNLLLVPPLGIIATVLGLAGALFGGPCAALGNLLLCLFDELLSDLLPALGALASLPGSELIVPASARLVPWALGGWVVILLVSPAVGAGRGVAGLGGIACLLAAALSLGTSVLGRRPVATVSFLNVGQGDACVLRGRDGRTVLVDAGPGGPHSFDAGERILLPWLRAAGIGRIDLLVLTHADADHVGGAETLLRRLPVGEIWAGGVRDTPVFHRLRKLAAERGFPWHELDVSARFRQLGAFRFDILNPSREAGGSDNDRSLVVRVETEGQRILFPGDIGTRTERALLKAGADLSSLVLKVAHHGSRRSSSAAFLHRVAPRYAVVSAGYKNRFRHPSPAVLDRLGRAGIRVWRGDLAGQIDLLLSRDRISIAPFGGIPD